MDRIREEAEQIRDFLLKHPLRREGRRLVIAIDGRCASGKTSVARILAGGEGFKVFHMDDYFPRPEQRTPERLAAPGGNVDHERAAEEILKPLKEGAGLIRHRAYDCRLQAMREPVTEEAGDLNILEGSYSCHPALWDHYDVRIFLTVPEKVQAKRILEREGERAEAFFAKWIPMEEAYFTHFKIGERCDLVIDTGRE